MNLNDMTKEELINYINNLNESESGKFGLVFEKEKTKEQIVIDCNKYLPVLTEIKEKSINTSSKLENILIEGDNFHALTTLNFTHQEKIDMIYIDPPYNTGHEDFVYNDKYVDLEDGYRHSKWLNFMDKRLRLAKDLLKEDGIICISIDDNELYQLKLLCDKIFSETNFIANLVIETANGVFGTRASQTKKTFVKVKDYILIYAKDKTKIRRDFNPLYMKTKEPFDTHYSIILDENLNKKSLIEYLQETPKLKNIFEKYHLKISLNNISKLMQLDDEFNEIMLNDLSEKIYQDVAFSLNVNDEEMKDLNQGKIIKYNEYIIFKTKEGTGTIRQYIPFKASLKTTDEYVREYKRAVAIGDLWKNFDLDMKNVSKEGGYDFKNGKKPVRLIKQLIKFNNKKDAIILDFFAGSGTTAQAVMEINEEDNGTRRFILSTNNENNICTNITYERIKNVINKNNSLRYYKTEFVENTNNKDQLFFDLTEKCIPLLYIKEDTFDEYKITDEYKIYKNKESTKYVGIYYDIFEEKYEEFLNILENIKEEKVLYIFSLGEYQIDEKLKKLKNYEIKEIPHKIVELYRRISRTIKED